MPVKPENKKRYPPNWSDLVEACKQRTIAANGIDCCEGSPDFPDCRRPNGWLLNKRTGELTDDGAVAESWALADGDKVSKIVLTTAHLDHTPETDDITKLRRWCQRCHLHYDKHHHANTSYATRMARRGNLELPL